MLTEDQKRTIREASNGVIVVSLDEGPFTAISMRDFAEAMERGDRYIRTPLTYVLDLFYCFNGYRLMWEQKGKVRCVNDILLGKIGPNEKELRPSHNIEKLILSGVYDIETEW